MNRTQGQVGRAIIGLIVVLIVGCAAGTFTKEETPGQRFERAMKRLADNCARAKLAPNDTACDILKLKPADPLATEEGRFAHSIKIPNPLPADSGYQPGMTPQEYFEHLCKTEAGEFIYKTVENVEGLYMMRPRREVTDYELEHLYALEDPFGQVLSESEFPQDEYVQPAMGKYEFLEMPLGVPQNEHGAPNKYRRYYRDDKSPPKRRYQTAVNGRFIFVPYVVTEANVTALRSRYGYTWRGTTLSHDRELGIAGGELIVLDLQTREVLAVRRGFIRSGWMKNLTGIWWLTGQTCPIPGAKREHAFIKEVLKPVMVTASDKEK
jgi:hypothetical protein